MQSERHVPLHNDQHNAFSSSADGLGTMRGRSESDGYRTMSARSSDDRAPLSTFFDSQPWQRMSTALPAGVRDPLNIDELEREERLMPFTEVAVGEMGAASLRVEPLSNHASLVPGSEHLQGSHRASAMSNFMAVSGGGTRGGPSEKDPIDWAYMQDHNLRTGGLPSLDQVLTRRTRAPLALRDFAVHCSVRQPQARRWLEFYMAARTHEKMCLAYESDLRHAKARSHYASTGSHAPPHQGTQHESRYDDSNEKPDPMRRAAAHNATMESLSRGQPDQLLYPEDSVRPMTELQDSTATATAKAAGQEDSFRRSRRQSSRMALQIQTAAETIFMRYFRAALDPNLAQGMGGFWQTSGSSSAAAAVARAQSGNSTRARGKMGSLKRMLTQKPSSSGGSRGLNQLQPTLNDPYHQGYGVEATDSVYAAGAPAEPRESGANSMYDNVHGQLDSTASLAMSREYLNTPITDNNARTQNFMTLGHGAGRGLGGAFTSSRHHLYYHMPWPPEILTEIEQRLLHDGAALDSSLFSEALLYAYDVLDTYYFPIFIADAVSRNVTRDHCVLRVFIAFLLLWFGFALPLALILLDHQPKPDRVWCILPQLIGWWNMAVGFGGCDPLLAVMRKYQSPIMKDVGGGGLVPAHTKNVRPKWTLKGKLDDWHRAWFSTRVSVDMTATRMVRARSIRWFIAALVMTGISTAILCAVPGTRIYRN
ncbi:hypothetical protein GGH15_004650 [Coemansia sp. RSA 562]|nr:hypothetical protein GGH15_004650 [Coemansia sp. RSA 562]